MSKEVGSEWGKKLDLFVPFIVWAPGLEVKGEIVRTFESTSKEYGEQKNFELRLIEPLIFINNDGEELTLDVDSHVNVGVVVALRAVYTLGPGKSVWIKCVGRKQYGNARKPAWDFEVRYK